MLQRKLESTLVEWKNRPRRKPLLIHGVRQTGKTFLMGEFAKRYFDSVISIDFSKTPEASAIFEGDIGPETIVPGLSSFTGVPYREGETLIVIDEIQDCPRALTSLKYFRDSGGDYFVIGAGSMLGVEIKQKKQNFPVGKVHFRRMTPLDFGEFLLAMGKSALAEMCAKAFAEMSALPRHAHEQLLSLYRTYLVVGGMPEVLADFVEDHSFPDAAVTQQDLLNGYHADIARYAPEDIKVKARRAYETLPAQLAKENRKFQYNLIRKGATAGLFGESLEWLTAAGLTLKCSKVTDPVCPLKSYEDLANFKLYLSDPGLLARMAGMPRESILNDYGERFMGGLVENYVASSFVSNGLPLFYWASEGKAEVDFLLESGTHVIPVEVKSSDRVNSKSLSVFRERYQPPLSIRISARNFGFGDGLASVPLYSVWLLNEENLARMMAMALGGR